MNAPDPKANTTTEAYLAYKAGYLEESELKPVLYEPYLHFDAWLAYWDGLTDTYPTDENGDPEMLTDEEALVAYLSGVTNTYPEEIKDPYDVRIVGYLKHIASIRFDAPDYPVNNEEFYLSTMGSSTIPSGDPSSDIEMNGTAEAPFASLEVYGDTMQQTTTGKNLFNNSTITFPSEATLNPDGSITVVYDNTNGSSTHYTNLYTTPLSLQTSTEYAAFAEILSLTGGGTLAVIGGASGISQFTNNRTFNLANYTAGDIIKAVDETKSDFTGTTTSTRTYVGVQAGLKVNITFRMSLIADTSVTPETFVYQPYTGGIPAPNPDFPETVNVVTGEQNVWVHGKNMLPFVNQNVTIGTLNAYCQNGSLYLNGTASASIGSNSSAWKNNFRITLPAGTYVLSGDTSRARTIRKVSDGSVVLSVGIGTSYDTFTLTEETEVYFGLYIASGASFSNYKFEAQLERNSTATATAYEPYQGATYKVDLTSKNLLDVSTFENGYINSSGTVSGGGGTNAVFGFMPVLPETDYTVSVQKNTFAMAIAYYDSNKTLISRITNDYVGRTSRTFTTPQNCAYARAGFYAGSGAGQSVMEEALPQFEKGSTPTSYQEFYDYKLCKISTYQDKIYESGDDWYVHKELGSITFDGTEADWLYSSSSAIPFRYRISDAGQLAQAQSTPPDVYSNYYTPSAWNNSTSVSYAVTAATNSASLNIICFRNIDTTTLDGWKTWLSTHNTSLYYPLATPTDTKITDATLISQLNAIKEGGSYNGKTYITVASTAPNLPALLKVEAYKY